MILCTFDIRLKNKQKDFPLLPRGFQEKKYYVSTNSKLSLMKECPNLEKSFVSFHLSQVFEDIPGSKISSN